MFQYRKLIQSTIIISLLLLVSGCSYYILTPEILVNQLETEQTIAPDLYFQQFSLVDYPSNNLEKIKCIDKNGNLVWLYPDKNTEFTVITKDSHKVKVYFDTMILQNDTLFGLRSRLLGGLRSIPISNVENVIIKAEFPKTRIIKKAL